MRPHKLFTRLAAVVTIVSAVAVSGCASNRLGHDAMRTTGVGIGPLGGLAQSRLDEDAARANIIHAGQNNPDARVRDYTNSAICEYDNDATARIRDENAVNNALAGRGLNSGCP